ncbi:damage-inducible protein DinB [Rhizobium grahamii]|uniref:Damage-inducible protein DinB n=1 Tax=Rhizobium grahamii TaxID=1120045 RepID=A0A5Q0C6I0_9HYPH|nr:MULTISPECIES: DinB family protein [Rhizobium]QFY59647.1 damage-inducible protein DinB [Rhizobium grahamii]QRM51242.1 damage-inducible protein DinB [Rhizobium sp. BG6]
MLKQYRMFADYNRWANDIVYTAAAELTGDEFQADRGAFFGSMQRTLNHILVADRIWMKRFSGTGNAPTSLDHILHADLPSLTEARRAEDQRIITWVDTLDDAAIAADFTYTPVTVSTVITQSLWSGLSHVFNHQTHHRGQCHMILTGLGKPSLSLDLAYYLRSDGKRWLGA